MSYCDPLGPPPRWIEPPSPTTYILGLDLGQAQDYTALCVVERTETPDPADAARKVRRYGVRHLERWPLGTDYTDIVDDLKAFAARKPLPGSPFVVDATGVGAAVVNMIARAKLGLKVFPVGIHGGHDVSPRKGGGFSVPKVDLVGVMQALIQADRFQIAPD